MVRRSGSIPLREGSQRLHGWRLWRCPRQCSRQAVGFSMVELVLVLATVAIIGAIGANRYVGAVSHYRADAAAKRVAADLAFAMSRARATSKPITVVFTTATKSYQMATVPDPISNANTYTVNVGVDPYNVGSLTANFAGASQVTFSIYGAPDNAGSVVIAAGGFTKTITLDGLTGKTTIQ